MSSTPSHPPRPDAYARGEIPPAAGDEQADFSPGLLQPVMLRAVSGERDKRETLESIAAILSPYLTDADLAYSERDASGELMLPIPLAEDATHRIDPDDAAEIQRLCNAACAHGTSCKGMLPSGRVAILVVPVFFQGVAPETFCLMMAAGQTIEAGHLETTVQFAAIHVTLWHTMQRSEQSSPEAALYRGFLDMLTAIEASPTVDVATHRFAYGLARWTRSDRVALGLCNKRATRCRLAALSGMATVDRRGEHVRNLESALDETLNHEKPCLWTDNRTEGPELKTYRQLAVATKSRCILGLPLQNGEGRLVGAAILLFSDTDREYDVEAQRVGPLAKPLANVLDLVLAARGGPLRRLSRAVGRQLHSWRGRLILLAVCALAAMLFVPMPFKIGCDCVLEPAARRFIAAPFDGTLEQAFVEPGALVAEGDLLARMDEREIRWELAGLDADYQLAKKRYDAALDDRKTSEVQVARLEMDRIDMQRQLAQHRRDNLAVKSPIGGVVVRGDLKRSEGTPLGIGQTLFEIAPLDQMVAEILIPEEEVAYVESGYALELRLDAFPRRKWSGQVEKVHPRAEIREQENVFIAEVALDNQDGILRPGMKGEVKIVATRQPWGWILFHRPVGKLIQRFGW